MEVKKKKFSIDNGKMIQPDSQSGRVYLHGFGNESKRTRKLSKKVFSKMVFH